MHLVARENLPEPATQGRNKSTFKVSGVSIITVGWQKPLAASLREVSFSLPQVEVIISNLEDTVGNSSQTSCLLEIIFIETGLTLKCN